jgi:hypothetical protein
VKLQTSNFKTVALASYRVDFWDLALGIFLGFGAWDLELPWSLVLGFWSFSHEHP